MLLQQNTAALVHPGEWDVLYRRAAYTRTIFKGSPRFCASSDVHVFLSYKTSGRPLFPNVQALSWFSETPNHLSLLPLLSPTVRMLKLSFGRGVDEPIPMHLMWRWVLLNQNQPDATEGIIIDQLLQTTLPRLGGLVELEVQGSVFVSPTQELESWARIGNLQNLRKLTLDHSCLIVNPAYLQHLAALPVLVELLLHLICNGATVQTSFPGFSALEKLTLDVYARSHEGIFDPFVSPGLHTLSVRLEYTTQAAMPAIVNDIARAYPHIRSITLKEHSRQSSEAPSTIPSFDAVFGRLAQHADVEEFVLHTRYGMSICTARDEDFSRLAQSWPRLRLFSFLSTHTVWRTALAPRCARVRAALPRPAHAALPRPAHAAPPWRRLQRAHEGDCPGAPCVVDAHIGGIRRVRTARRPHEALLSFPVQAFSSAACANEAAVDVPVLPRATSERVYNRPEYGLPAVHCSARTSRTGARRCSGESARICRVRRNV